MNLTAQSLVQIFERDLTKLEGEIKLFSSDASLWKTFGDVKNPAGNLCLHLCGNLQYYIGAILGGSAYVRNRDLEFAAKNVPRETLVQEIRKAKTAVMETLPKLDSFMMEQEYPLMVFEKTMTTTFFLIHLSAHFGYHLGQVNYLRRLLPGFQASTPPKPGQTK
ncbi:MAG TPA: DUF1572 family protein [Chryseolinea sp.]|nr:DUF1572 family protein [Chryseolinea sp.]